MTNPRVSVIIPTFNRAAFIRRCLDSVIAQTITDWECIVVDDGSTDDTEAVVRSIGDARITYVTLAENRGAPVARNQGISMARGTYVAFLDSDCEFAPGKLEEQLRVFTASTDPTLGVVTCGNTTLEWNTERVLREYLPAGIELNTREQLLHVSTNVQTITLLVRRECLNDIRFDESLPQRQDWDLCVQLSERYSFSAVQKLLTSSYRHSGPKLSTTRPWRGWEICLAKYRHELRRRPKALSRHHYSIHRLHLEHGMHRSAARQLLLALRYDPLHPKRWIRLLALAAGIRSKRLATVFRKPRFAGLDG